MREIIFRGFIIHYWNKNDTIYYFTRTDGRLGYTYITGHKSELNQSLKEYSPFRYHYEIFKDSLTDESEDYDMITNELSYHYLDEYVKRLKREHLMASLLIGDGIQNIHVYHSISTT